jgi:hypothetical protein
MDRNDRARLDARNGKGAMGAFTRRNGSSVMVPERLAQGGNGGEGGVAIAIIARSDNVSTNFAMALAATEYMLGRLGINFFLICQKGSVPAENRNRALEQARSQKAEYVLLVDADTTFPPNALPRLLHLAREHGADILGPTAPRREHPHDNMAIAKAGPQTLTVGNLVEVRALPGAFVLVRLAALEKLKRPYFRYPTVEEGAPIPEELANLGLKEGEPAFASDMLYFCDAARAAGINVWLDAELSGYTVTWGEAGFQLTGTEDPNAPQFRILEAGKINPLDAAQEAANQARNDAEQHGGSEQ